MFGMNVSDPLWNSATSGSNTPVTTDRSRAAAVQANKILSASMIEGREVLSSILRDRATPVTASATLNSQHCTSNCTTSSISATTTSLTLSGINETVSAALSSQPSPHLWSFKQFWWISASTTAATILFPLLAPLVFRATIRSFDNHRGYWMLTVFLIGAAGATLMDVYIPHPDLYYVLGVPQAVIALIGLFGAHRATYHVPRWIGYATVLVACITFDVGTDDLDDFYEYDNNKNNINEGRFGLTGVLPPLCLFAIWVQSGRSYVSRARIEDWISRLPSWLQVIRVSEVINKVHDFRAFVEDRSLVEGLLVAVAGVLNGVLSWFIPDSVYLGLMATSFGLYSLHRLFESFEWQIERPKWILFAAVVACSIVVWWYTEAGVLLGSIALFPGLYLLACAKGGSIMKSVLGLWMPARFRTEIPDTEDAPMPSNHLTHTQSLNLPAHKALPAPTKERSVKSLPAPRTSWSS